MKQKGKAFCLMMCGVLIFFVLALGIPVAHGEQKEIRILHVNDFHGYATEYRPSVRMNCSGAWPVSHGRRMC